MNMIRRKKFVNSEKPYFDLELTFDSDVHFEHNIIIYSDNPNEVFILLKRNGKLIAHTFMYIDTGHIYVYPSERIEGDVETEIFNNFFKWLFYNSTRKTSQLYSENVLKFYGKYTNSFNILSTTNFIEHWLRNILITKKQFDEIERMRKND